MGCKADKIISVDFHSQNFSGGNGYGIAIDIGTTTLVFELVQEGKRIAVFSCVNSQREFGLDVISRISQAVKGKAEHLHLLIIKDIEQGISNLLTQSGLEKKQISRIVICGNTTMLHLLQNFSCENLGIYPFTPVSVEMSVINIFGLEAIILPGISAFVGADIVAGFFYCEELADSFLLIDLGTNGEIVLSVNGKIFATSVAAGPAFEGGNISSGTASIPGAIAKVRFSPQNNSFEYETVLNKTPVGICGTGVISVCAEMLRHGFSDKTGLLKSDIEIAENIYFTQKDMREVQLAKSAVRAGIEILTEEANISYDCIEKVFLAGGFGYTMDVEDAAILGIIPRELKIFPVGNAALGGAVKFLCTQKIPDIKIKEINLATHPRFEELFIKYCNF